MEKLVEGKDFYYSKGGNKILTEDYLTRRGHCCKSGCLNCPYESGQERDPSIPSELHDPWKPQKDDENPEIYSDEIPDDENL